MRRRNRLFVTAALTVVALAVVAVGGVYLTMRTRAVAYAPPSDSSPGWTRPDLEAFRAKRVYFGHQSVGKNILDGLSRMYSDAGDPPNIQEVSRSADAPNPTGGVLLHSRIGENGDPQSKFAAFDRMMRSGLADTVDVALMKLCYVDFGRRSDPREVFDRYKATMSALERDYPNVTFVYTTVPLTTGDGWRNQLRTQFNSMVRTELAGKPLFDIADAESRDDNGSRATGSAFGFPYEQLLERYASDGAHLNADGAQQVARSLVAVVNGTRR